MLTHCYHSFKLTHHVFPFLHLAVNRLFVQMLFTH
nr:MAG TPA: hypothetical protein [Caudoviricetes sp.]